MRQFLKKAINRAGWDLYRLSPDKNPKAQLLAALNHVGSNFVFDVGANVGQFAGAFRSIGFNGKIVSFEPLSSAHKELSSAARHDSGWLVHPRTAVGDREGEIEMNISGNSVSSSALPMLNAHASASSTSAYVGAELAPLVRLDAVAEQYLDDSSRPFIKVDTQGFEWEVLDGAAMTLKRTRGVLLELSLVPLYDGQQLWQECIARMNDEGFVLWALQRGFTDPRTGQSLQTDAIFLRRDMVAA